MKRLDFFLTIYKNDEDRRVARVLLKIILALLGAYLVVIGMELYWGDSKATAITLAGIGLLLFPLGLLTRGYLRIGGLVVVLVSLITVTIIATVGQGIHDIAIMGYPVIVVIASLIMQRRDFFLSSLLTMGALGWLVFGEAFRLFVSRTYEIPGTADFLVVAVILLVAIMAVDSLAENIRENMHQAHQEIERRKTMETQLRHQSTHDELTGIYNRLFFEEGLLRLEHSRQFPVSIIVADIDDLKIVNDTKGHAVGDELLRHATAILHATFRTDDILARIGGDEFAVLLPRTDLATVDIMLARVRSKITEHNTNYPEFGVQLSLGASTAEQGKLAEAFIIADRQMYANKSTRKSKYLATPGLEEKGTNS